MRWFSLAGRLALTAFLVLAAPVGAAPAIPEQPMLRAGSETGFPPYADVDARGRPTGFSVELLAAVADAIDARVWFREGSWDTVWNALKRGEIDVLPLVARLPEREGQVEFTRPHTLGYDAFFVRKGLPAIATIDRARAMSIIVVRADAAHDALVGRGFDRQLVVVNDLAEAFRLLAGGQHDAVLAPLIQGNMQVRRLGLGAVVESGPLLKEYRREFCFAVKKGDTVLRDRLDQGLAIVKASGEYDRLYRKWLGIHEPVGFPVAQVAWSAVGVASLLALLALWNWQLRRRVSARTEALSEEIAARKAAEGQLLAREKVLESQVAERTAEIARAAENTRLFVEHAPVGIAMFDRDMNYLAYSRRWLEDYGRGYDSLTGRNHYLVHPDTPEAWREVHRRGLAGETLKNEADHWRQADGSDHWLRWAVLPWRNAAGAIGGIIISSEDISDSKRTERELSESRARLAGIIDSAMDAIVTLDEKQRVRMFNPAAERMFGIAAAEMVGQTIDRLIPERLRQAHGQYMRRFAEEGATSRGMTSLGELRARRQDGSEFPIEASISKTDIVGEKIFTVILRDITERKAAEQTLRDSEERFQLATEIGRSGTWDWNVRSGEVIWSRGHYEILGYRIGEVRPTFQAWINRVHPDDRRAVDEGVMLSMCEHRDYVAEFRIVWPDGSVHWMSAHGRHEYGADGTWSRMLGVMADVTPLKEAEEALREADRHKDEFLAMLAHELRNPLTPITAAAHLLEQPKLDEAQRRWAVAAIADRVKHITRLVDDLLDVSRISRGRIELKREAVAFADLVARVVESVRPALDAKRHHFALSLPHGPVQLDADPVRLTQVLVNLLDNAAKYTPEGGHIELAARVAEGEIEIAVRDDGPGMPADLLPHVFELFRQGERTLDRSQGGLGIGLSLVERLVRMHGGRIAAASPGSGRGSVFTVWLPIRAMVAAPVAAMPTPTPTPASNGLRVLVVDDDRLVAYGLNKMLSLHGHTVVTAASGEEALERVEAFRPQAILLDIGLVGMDGYETARRLRSRPDGDGFRLIALSGYGDAAAQARSSEAGFDAHLVKPADYRRLAEELARVEA